MRRPREKLRYLEDSEHLQVSVTELQEQLGRSKEAGVSTKQFAQHARNENGQKIFEFFRQLAGPDGTHS